SGTRWLSCGGYVHAGGLRTIEGITRPNRDTLRCEATLIGPGAYSEPWTIAWDIEWLEGAGLAEYICQENNQFLIDLKDDFGMPFFQRPDPEEILRSVWRTE